ncbi:MAG: bifunctional 3-deoxy-7-phosphoheptulonate synthase/chorismate mutase type II [Bacteroidetes bacterium]|nr:bifunctional 3-deoxy-7-phosphoheptulonate synthase/chorismate mutase type II [Bacteroidota bacterium]
MTKQEQHEWFEGRNQRPMIIAGPCSAETEQQTMQTAEALVNKGYRMFRAGLWKPRTRPGMFDGVGNKGLPWLRRVKTEFGMSVGTEVANGQHVLQSLKYNLDFIWIGARTTANPFAVQEIADALQGAEIPVLVKNPVNPDLELWMGAIERLQQAGISKLAAVHRGFSSYVSSGYRNHPHWLIPIELHRRMPGLPIITDPSHIAGTRTLIAEICQQAMDLNFNGLMVECHISPDEAWSDARQQITPDQLSETLGALKYRNQDAGDLPRTRLDDLRMKIDDIDNQLIELLSERMKVSTEIGLFKKENNITILQSSRYSAIIHDRTKRAARKGLEAEFIGRIFETIHEASVLNQHKVMNINGKNHNQA